MSSRSDAPRATSCGALRPSLRALPLALLLAILCAGCSTVGNASSSSNSRAAIVAGHAAQVSAAPSMLAAPVAPVPPAPTVQAPIAFLMNPYTGAVYLAQNADQPVAMASTTKIMTALVAISYGKLDAPYTIPYDATPAAIQQVNDQASLAYLQAGDKLTLRQLLYGLLLPSGDDAAAAVADEVAGSQADFVKLMNLEATLLGLTHTHYADVHGLDAPGHYTSARDLATLAAAAMHSPTFAQVVGTAHYHLTANADHHEYDWWTTNALLASGAYPGLSGIKTGFTGGAHHCLVFAATRPYGHLLGVVLGDGDDPARFNDAVALLDWGFQQQRAAMQHWVSIPHGQVP